MSSSVRCTHPTPAPADPARPPPLPLWPAHPRPSLAPSSRPPLGFVAPSPRQWPGASAPMERRTRPSASGRSSSNISNRHRCRNSSSLCATPDAPPVTAEPPRPPPASKSVQAPRYPAPPVGREPGARSAAAARAVSVAARRHRAGGSRGEAGGLTPGAGAAWPAGTASARSAGRCGAPPPRPSVPDRRPPTAHVVTRRGACVPHRPAGIRSPPRRPAGGPSDEQNPPSAERPPAQAAT
eukprot:scaffold3146_cov98-Isochrysis_galbana.AAC.6